MQYYAYGSAILTSDELRDTGALVAANAAAAAVSRGGRMLGTLKMINGEIAPSMVSKGISSGGDLPPIPWEPIGLGKPLTISIREVYTGKGPNKGFLGKSKQMLLTTAVKSIATYEAKPRALNFLTDNISKQTRLTRPSASKEGTPIVYHSPAVTERSLTLDVTIIFDSFPKEAFDAVGSAFQEAAGIPIFLAHSAYLIAAGQIAKLVGSAGEALFDGKPTFDVSEAINIQWPGEPAITSGYLLLTPSDIDKLDPGFRAKYQILDGTLTDKSGKAYTGDISYVVLALDGTPDDAFASFTPTAASAAVLSRFFGMKDGQHQPIGIVLDALKLYSDFSFRTQLDDIDKRIAKTTDAKEKETLETRRDAVAKNIVNDFFKPKDT